MNKLRIASLKLFSVFLLTFPTSASAEPTYCESVEWITADSDLVVVGKVTTVANANGHEAATVAVSKTFKGAPTDSVTFLLRNYNGPAAVDWMTDGIPLVFFVVKRDRAPANNALPEKFEWVLRDDHNDHSAVLLGIPKREWTHTIPVFTRKFHLLTKSDAILKRIEDTAKIVPQKGVARSREIEVPYGNRVYEKKWSMSPVYMTVPEDDEVEEEPEANEAGDVISEDVRWWIPGVVGLVALFGLVVCLWWNRHDSQHQADNAQTGVTVT